MLRPQRGERIILRARLAPLRGIVHALRDQRQRLEAELRDVGAMIEQRPARVRDAVMRPSPRQSKPRDLTGGDALEIRRADGDLRNLAEDPDPRRALVDLQHDRIDGLVDRRSLLLLFSILRARASTQQLRPRGGVRLARLRHAGADELLQITVCGHRSLRDPRTPKPRLRLRGQEDTRRATGGVISPLPQRGILRGGSIGVRRRCRREERFDRTTRVCQRPARGSRPRQLRAGRHRAFRRRSGPLTVLHEPSISTSLDAHCRCQGGTMKQFARSLLSILVLGSGCGSERAQRPWFAKGSYSISRCRPA